MEPAQMIQWAVGAGVAWLIFSSMTGLGNRWVKHADADDIERLERRVASLEQQLAALQREQAGRQG